MKQVRLTLMLVGLVCTSGSFAQVSRTDMREMKKATAVEHPQKVTKLEDQKEPLPGALPRNVSPEAKRRIMMMTVREQNQR